MPTAPQPLKDEGPSRAKALAAEREAAHYLPAGGKPDRSALRSHKQLRVPQHRAMSEVLGVLVVLRDTAEVLGLSVTERGEMPDLQRGEGLWRVRQRAFVVRHLVTDGELRLLDIDSRMLGASRGFTNSETHWLRSVTPQGSGPFDLHILPVEQASPGRTIAMK